MINLPDSLRSFRQKIKYNIGKYPAIFYPIFTQIPFFRSLAADSRTQLVIEGFPRSANTYCVFAFQHIQPVKIKIAHHFHVPCQILRGIELNLPILLLIRNPKDVAISHSVYFPNVSIEQILRQYIDYYDFLYNYQSAYFIAHFEDVINDFESIVHGLNLKFGTNFAGRKLSAQEDKLIFDKIRKQQLVSKLEKERNSYIPNPKLFRQKIRVKIEEKKYKQLLEKAESVYQRYVNY